MAKFKYYIGATEVLPLGDWKLKASRKKDYIFYRWEFAGKLKFIKDDYDLITAFDYGTEIPFTIECNANDGNAEPFAWNGYFKYPVDFFFDDDKCTCEGEPHVDDEYRCFLENEDVELIFEGADVLETVEIYDNPRTPLKLYTILYCALFDSLIERIITEYKPTYNQQGIDCDIHSPFNIVSAFFWNDNYEDDTPSGINNYVTDTTNKLSPLNNYYLFFQKTNTAINQMIPGTCDSVGLFRFTFKDFFQWLYNMFQVRWYIDSNLEFRIEHVYYFEKDFPNSDFGTDGLDFTTLTSSTSKLPYADNHNKYEYILQDLITNEILIIGDSINEDFLGEKIYYNEEYVDMLGGSKKEEEYNVSHDTDVQSMIDDSESYCKKNLTLFHCKYEDLGAGNEYIVQLETGVLSSALQQNGHLSVANLQDNYWKHDRPFINGYINGFWQTFDTTKRVKKQEKFTVPLCCATEFNPMDYHKTDLGWGQVKEATIASDGSLEIILLHESDLIPGEF